MSNAAAIRAGRAAVELSVTDDQFKKGLDNAQRNFKTFQKGLAGTAKSLQQDRRGSGEQALENILRGGPSSIIGAGADLLGAGAWVVGIELAGRALKAMTSRALELREQLAEGKITIAEMADELAKQIPIYGSIYAAGRDIHELIFGQKAAIDVLNREAKLTTEFFDAQVTSSRTLQQILRSSGVETSRMRADIAAINADSFTREKLAIQQAATERKITAEQKQQKDLEDVAKAPSVAVQEKIVDDKRKQLRGKFDYYAQSNEAEQIVAKERAEPGSVRRDVMALAEEAVEGERYLNTLRQKVSHDQQRVRDAAAEQAGVAAEKDARELADVERRAMEAYSKGVVEAINAASDETINARVEDLKRQGKQAEAEKLMIDRDAAQKKKAAMQAAAAQMAASGATGPYDPRFVTIVAAAAAQASAIEQDAAAKLRTINSGTFEEQAGQVRDLAELRSERIKDDESRERASLSAKQKYELDVATQAGRDTTAIKARHLEELANIESRYQEERREKTQDIDEQIARARIEATLTGVAREAAILELEKKKMLQDMTGLDNGRIEELFRLKAAALNGHEATGTFGTFSAVAASAAGAIAGGHIARSDSGENAAKETAKNTAKIAVETAGVREAIQALKPSTFSR